MAFIFVQSALPGDLSGAQSGIIVGFLHGITGMDPEVLSLIVRKVAHFLEYMILGACLTVNVRDCTKLNMKTASIAWLISTAYAVTDEIHQYFVEGRACSPVDVLIDSAGALVGVGITRFALSQRRSDKVK